MLYFRKFEHIDDFEGDKVMWIEVHEFGVPKEIKKKAQEIDGEDYDGNCFGICINYDSQIPELYVCQDEINCELYYVANDGEKHWFEYQLSEMEEYLFFAECIKEMENM